MWVIIVSDANKERNSQYIFHDDSEFELSIGRTIDNKISYPDDKSISRAHAILKHQRDIHGNYTLYITDLISKYGTFMNKDKLPANESIAVPRSGATIKVGASTARIIVTHKIWKFCTSRLDKESKEVLSRRLSYLGAITVPRIEDANFLIMNEYTATLKSLIAIVMKIPLVKTSWLDFVDSKPFDNMIEVPDCSK